MWHQWLWKAQGRLLPNMKGAYISTVYAIETQQ